MLWNTQVPGRAATRHALISVPLLEGMIAGVLGETTSPSAPLANPLYADFTGFPPLYVNAGSVESLVDNAIRVAERAKGAGVDVTLHVAEGQQHVYPFLAGRDADVDAESSLHVMERPLCPTNLPAVAGAFCAQMAYLLLSPEFWALLVLCMDQV